MTHHFFKKFLKSFITVIFMAGFIFSGCDDSGSKGNGDSETGSLSPGSRSSASSPHGPDSLFRYRYGLAKAMSIPSDKLVREYNKWHSWYVTSEGAGGYLRVKRDVSSYFDTVSEGIAYGMLLALYFNDRNTFDNLYKYALKHRVSDDKYLMHWKVTASGEDVSEFQLKVPHDSCYLVKEYIRDESTVAYIKENYPWLSVKDKELVKKYPWLSLEADNKKVSNWNIDRDDERLYVKSIGEVGGDKDNYLKACRYERDRSSAADADFDMAAALVMASYKITNGNTKYYREEAAKMIKAIIKHDITTWGGGAFIRNGSAWGNKKCWNPSYFAPAWFKLYIKFINDHKYLSAVRKILTEPDSRCESPEAAVKILQETIDNVYAEFKKRENTRAMLPPDWCNTYDTAYMKRGEESDRIYYLDENKDGLIDDKNGNGVHGDKGDGYSPMMSFNFYYDAVRTPWRLAVDYSWYGDSRAYKELKVYRKFFATKGKNLVDGYTIHGEKWSRSLRDGFNNFIPGLYQGGKDSGALDGGQWKNNTTFTAMCATAFMPYGQSSAELWAKRALDINDYSQEKFTYYGNTMRLLSLVYLSGFFTNVTSKIAIKSVGRSMDENKNMYVCADRNIHKTRPLCANKTSIGAYETFELVQGEYNYVSLRFPHNNRFVGFTTMDDSYVLTANKHNGKSTADFKLYQDSGKTVFYHKKSLPTPYVCADAELKSFCPLSPNKSEIGPCERFELIMQK